MRHQKHIFPLVRRLLGDRVGTSAVEVALCLPVILGMIIPMTDLGMGAYTQMQVQNAAQAGAEYAAKAGFNASAITSAVTNATGLAGITATPAPSQSCGCVTGTIVSNLGAPPCSQTCPTGTVGIFVTVNAQAQYSTIFPYPAIPSPLNISAKATIRVVSGP